MSVQRNLPLLNTLYLIHFRNRSSRERVKPSSNVGNNDLEIVMHRSATNMDPVLSSTVEFDEYIKSNMNIARAKVLSSRNGVSKDTNNLNYKNAKPSTAATDTKDSRIAQNRGHMSNSESKELSQDFLKMNINKYHHAVPSYQQPVASSRRDYDEEVPAVALKHSWKAHLTAPSKFDTVKPSRTVAQDTEAAQRSPNKNSHVVGSSSGRGSPSKMSYDDDWDLAWDNLQPPSPVSEARTTSTSRNNRPVPTTTAGSTNLSRQATKYENSPGITHQSVRTSNTVNDSVDFGAYKVRLVVLKRCFAEWSSYTEHSVEALMRTRRDVTENCVYWPKRSCFTWWHMLYTAAQQMKMYCKIRVIRKFALERKKCRRSRTSMRKAAYHDKFTQFERFMVAMRRLGLKRRRRKLGQRREVAAFNFRNVHLARMVLVAWKSVVAKAHSDRLLYEEQAVRKDKIAMFMKRVQGAPNHVPPQATSVVAAGKSSGGTGIPAPVRAPSRGRSDAKSTPSHASTATHQQQKSSDRRASASQESQAKSAPRSPPKSLRNPLSPSPPAAAAGGKSPVRYNSKESKFTDSFDVEYDGDDFEEEGADPPPPSYDALMRRSQASMTGSGGDGDDDAALQDFSNIRLSGGDRGLPPLPPPLPPMPQDNGNERCSGDRRSLTSRTARTGACRMVSEAKEGEFPHTSRSAGAATVGVAEGTQQGTLEERAAARRQRVILLKKQAEERIQEKQQQKLALERQKHEREIEAAEAIRKEARAKNQQTKQLAERSRAEQTDQLRELLGRARRFRHTQLLIRCGIAPWQQYMEILRLDEMKAVHFRNDRLLLSAWTALLGYIIALRTERFRREHRLTAVATAHYRRMILKAVWRMLRMHHRVILAKTKAVTGHFSRFTLCRRSFHAWRVAYERSVRVAVRQYRSVQPRGDLCLQRHFWRLWCAYHKLQLEEREIRQRVNSKWAAVQGWMSNRPY